MGAMSTNDRKLTKSEIQLAFSDSQGSSFPAILSLVQVSQLTGTSRKTLYEWIARGRLDGSFRKRGKHFLFWRDRVIDIIFNGPNWK